MNDNLNPENSLDYMFDIPDKDSIRQVMLCGIILKLSEFRNVFYKSDLSLLEDFSFINNVHAYYKLGCYIAHNDFVEDPFVKTDDFEVVFSIKDYNEAKKIKIFTKEYDYFEQL